MTKVFNFKEEQNPFQYFIPTGATILILGSFPCFNGRDYGDFFNSGSGKNYFWPLLSEVFRHPATTLQDKMTLCERHHLALADVAARIYRKKGNCSDNNLVVLEWNRTGIELCLQKGITTIFCTSRFVEFNFNRLMPDCQCTVIRLPSPSPAANRHIARLPEYQALKKKEDRWSPYAFRLLYYKALLQ